MMPYRDPMDELRDRRLTRADGRVVAYTDWGAAEGRPMLRIPGTPGSRFSLRGDTAPWSDRNLRMITTERQGYGASTRLPGRRFAEHADDLAAILDDLGIDRLPVIGGSGAAPHVLAFAAGHPDRVSAATILVGAAPLDDDEVDQMIEINVIAHRLYEAGDEHGCRALLNTHRDAILADPLAGFRSIMADAPPADQDVMNDEAWQQAFVRAITESLRPGIDGWYDEGVAIHAPWDDIALDEVTCSVTWWHAEHDRNAPLSSARRLVEQLPNARLEVWPEGGHFTGYHREGEILDELLARADR
jgi:pimeloyl-ACP methyl ester carboxylesterase